METCHSRRYTTVKNKNILNWPIQPSMKNQDIYLPSMARDSLRCPLNNYQPYLNKAKIQK